MTGQDQRAAYITGLRQLADALEQHDEIKLPENGSQNIPLAIYFWNDDTARESMAATARALPTSWAKNVSEKYLRLNGQLAGLHVELISTRDAVCTRRVTGTEKREVTVEVEPAKTRTEVQDVDVVEWDCAPILAPRPAAEAGAA